MLCDFHMWDPNDLIQIKLLYLTVCNYSMCVCAKDLISVVYVEIYLVCMNIISITYTTVNLVFRSLLDSNFVFCNTTLDLNILCQVKNRIFQVSLEFESPTMT